MRKTERFEDFIIECCAAGEPELRDFIKEELSAKGFNIFEDDYLSSRKGYESVKNLLAIKGEPKVCLVAHTDVCRDHSYRAHRSAAVNPVFKDYNGRQIIQDKFSEVQVGGDDRLGVAINLWSALNCDTDVALLFTTDEEIGLVSAGEVSFPQLKTFDLLAQVDRGNRNRQLVVNIGGLPLCSQATAERLLKIASDINLPRDPVMGLITDVYSIKGNGMCKEAVNMTCGYYNNHSNDEYIDVQDAKDTLEYVGKIIENYETAKQEEKEISNDE